MGGHLASSRPDLLAETDHPLSLPGGQLLSPKGKGSSMLTGVPPRVAARGWRSRGFRLISRWLRSNHLERSLALTGGSRAHSLA